ncbi:MAG: hypothetical protein SF029_08050 [bacterium]|nr:hypothetical protein [bacterium]
MHNSNYELQRGLIRRRGCLFTAVLVLITLVGCISTSYITIDVSCIGDANRWLQDYPGSRVVMMDYSWLRPFGIGETRRILYTPDAAEEVEHWYRQNDIDLGLNGDRRDDGTAVLRWAAAPYPQGEGAVITLYSSCAPQLAVGE